MVGRMKETMPLIATMLGFEHHFTVFPVGSLGDWLAGRDVGAVENCIAKLLEPLERGVFDGGFGEGGHGL